MHAIDLIALTTYAQRYIQRSNTSASYNASTIKQDPALFPIQSIPNPTYHKIMFFDPTDCNFLPFLDDIGLCSPATLPLILLRLRPDARPRLWWFGADKRIDSSSILYLTSSPAYDVIRVCYHKGTDMDRFELGALLQLVGINGIYGIKGMAKRH